MMKHVKLNTVEDVVKDILNEIDNATREKTGGTFVNFDGTRKEW